MAGSPADKKASARARRRRSSLRSSSLKPVSAAAAPGLLSPAGPPLVSPAAVRQRGKARRHVAFARQIVSEEFVFASGRPPSYHLETGRVESKEVEAGIDPKDLTADMLREDVAVMRHYLHLASAAPPPDLENGANEELGGPADGAGAPSAAEARDEHDTARRKSSRIRKREEEMAASVANQSVPYFQVLKIESTRKGGKRTKEQLMAEWLDLRTKLHSHERDACSHHQANGDPTADATAAQDSAIPSGDSPSRGMSPFQATKRRAPSPSEDDEETSEPARKVRRT